MGDMSFLGIAGALLGAMFGVWALFLDFKDTGMRGSIQAAVLGIVSAAVLGTVSEQLSTQKEEEVLIDRHLKEIAETRRAANKITPSSLEIRLSMELHPLFGFDVIDENLIAKGTIITARLNRAGAVDERKWAPHPALKESADKTFQSPVSHRSRSLKNNGGDPQRILHFSFDQFTGEEINGEWLNGSHIEFYLKSANGAYAQDWQQRASKQLKQEWKRESGTEINNGFWAINRLPLSAKATFLVRGSEIASARCIPLVAIADDDGSPPTLYCDFPTVQIGGEVFDEQPKPGNSKSGVLLASLGVMLTLVCFCCLCKLGIDLLRRRNRPQV